MKKIFVFALLALLCVSLAACENKTPEASVSSELLLPTVPETLEGSFSDALLRSTAEHGNRTVSPFSAKLCLALLANGAKGETRAQILNAIGVTDLDAYNRLTEATLARYAAFDGVLTVSVADSLWLNQSRFDGKGEFLDSYVQAMRKSYDAEVREVTSENSVEEVNAWVKEKTREKITEILTDKQRNFSAALVNALYFNAAWASPFEPERTDKGEFLNADDTRSDIDFMHQTDRFGYYENGTTQILSMPYSRYNFVEEKYAADADFSMYVILSDTLPDAEKLLSEAAFTYEKVNVTLPKFEFSYGFKLDEILQALGMTDAYSENKADFSAMMDPEKCPNGLILDSVLQKTYILVNETGTEAAAVTAAIMTEGCASMPEKIYDFTADRPFTFAVRDNTTGELLFLGRFEYGE